MAKPRIFLGSSGKQAKLLQALTRGLEDVADVEPWTTTFNPGTTTLGRLVGRGPDGPDLVAHASESTPGTAVGEGAHPCGRPPPTRAGAG